MSGLLSKRGKIVFENASVGGEEPEDPVSETPGLMPYSYLCGAGAATETRLIELPEDRLNALLRALLAFVQVDENWYLKTNPDVSHEVKTGGLPSARAHYITSGFFENRWPFQIVVDDDWYLEQYPDVKTAITRSSVSTCQDHFNRYGFREGRLPYKGWSLLENRLKSDY
ncbi:MAG: hypothetical protein PHT60_14420 [Acidiphilium sp.]|nr:hypothetical protein [Acidiphilium sp.]MDD4936956.1 hypothetical protein [Acidiphilium sp.]